MDRSILRLALLLSLVAVALVLILDPTTTKSIAPVKSPPAATVGLAHPSSDPLDAAPDLERTEQVVDARPAVAPAAVIATGSAAIAQTPQLPIGGTGQYETPSELLTFYAALRTGLLKQKELIDSGRSGSSSKREFARLSAIGTLMDSGRYWFVGDIKEAPKLPHDDLTRQYARLHYATGRVAIFEISEAEFPGTRAAESMVTAPDSRPTRDEQIKRIRERLKQK